MAAEQFKRACNPTAKQTLTCAERITDWTEGPIVRKVQKEDITRLAAERLRFERYSLALTAILVAPRLVKIDQLRRVVDLNDEEP